MYVTQEYGRKFFDIFCLRSARRYTFCWIFRYKKNYILATKSHKQEDKIMENDEKNGFNFERKTARSIIMLPVSEVRPYEKNPRKNAGAVKYVKASIEKFGFKQPIIVDSNRVIIAGHTRLEAAKSLGMSEVPCIVADDLTDAQVKALRLADNKVAEFSEWEMNLLGEELGELAEISDIDMSDFGFDDNLDNIGDEEENGTEENGVNLSETFQIIVECENEIEQQDIFEKLSGEGFKCRLSTL